MDLERCYLDQIEVQLKTLEQVKIEYTIFILYKVGSLSRASKILGITRRSIKGNIIKAGLSLDMIRKFKNNPLIKEKYPFVEDKDYCCMPNLTPEERDFIYNRRLNIHLPGHK